MATASKLRENQRQRTRKDLLRAAAELLGEGARPTLADVAERAMLSRATAYRYFPSIEALLAEAPLDGVVPEPTMFAGDDSKDAAERVDRAEAALHQMSYSNEGALRAMLAHAVTPRSEDGPIRQNRRQGLIEAALEPARDQLDDATYERLCKALAMVFGTESMIVFRDVLGVDADTARDVKSWAVRALVEAALGAR
jgi:AcrR family transcriptional regulator